jgi:hypothetical protein
MASLKNLTATKNNNFPQVTETNVESGQIYNFQANNFEGLHAGICFHPCQSGTAIIEIWGAGGSGAKMCCCGFGTPGNPGAYSKKTVTLTCCGYITGSPGIACGNDALCFRGCSDATGVTIYANGSNTGCMCAQGGRGGISYCSTGTNAYCCFVAGGFYHHFRSERRLRNCVQQMLFRWMVRTGLWWRHQLSRRIQLCEFPRSFRIILSMRNTFSHARTSRIFFQMRSCGEFQS